MRAAIFSSVAVVHAVSGSMHAQPASVGNPIPPAAQAALVAGMTQIVWAKGRRVPLCFGIAPTIRLDRWLETSVPEPHELRDPSPEVLQILSLHEPDVHPMSECAVIEGASPVRVSVRGSENAAAIIWLRDVRREADSIAVGRVGYNASHIGQFLCEARLRSKRWERAYCIGDW